MRILIISPYLPHRAVGHGGGTATYQLTRALARKHEVTLLCFQRSDEQGLERDLEAQGVRLELIPYRSGQDRGAARITLILDRCIRLLIALVANRPYRSVRYANRRMQQRLNEILGQYRPDLVQVEYLAMAPYARQARKYFDTTGPESQKESSPTPPRARIFLNTHEVETLVRLRRLMAAKSPLARWRASLALRRIRSYETRALAWADRVLCVSEQDRTVLSGLTAAQHLTTMPLGMDMELLPPVDLTFEQPPRLLFIGSFDHPPNRQAALLLVEELMPALVTGHPDVVLDIVGRRPPKELRDAAARQPDRVRLHGFVEDLAPLFHRAWIFVAPLFEGGGIKIKILEAMGRGSPVLTTPIGLDGIDALSGEHAISASDMSEFAEETRRLLSDKQQLMRLGSNGRALIEERYSWKVIGQRLLDLAGQGRSL